MEEIIADAYREYESMAKARGWIVPANRRERRSVGDADWIRYWIGMSRYRDGRGDKPNEPRPKSKGRTVSRSVHRHAHERR